MHESENATVVTSLSSHAAITYDMKNLGTGQMSSHVQLLRPELNCLQQGEAALTEALLLHHIVPPPKIGLLREVVKKKHHSEGFVLQDQFLDEFIFKGEVKDGFYVEAGADDFLINTNTLLFEQLHGWTGLLVEPLASQFQHG